MDITGNVFADVDGYRITYTVMLSSVVWYIKEIQITSSEKNITDKIT